MKKPEQWKGYTLEELRYKRVMTAARIELTKDRLEQAVEPFSSPTKIATSIFDRLSGVFSYLTYGVLAYNIFRKVRKIFKSK